MVARRVRREGRIRRAGRGDDGGASALDAAFQLKHGLVSVWSYTWGGRDRGKIPNPGVTERVGGLGVLKWGERGDAS